MSSSFSETVVPRCVICLLQASASMASMFMTPRGEYSKFGAARLLLDRILDWLVEEQVSGRLVSQSFEVAVVTHCVISSTQPTFTSLLPGSGNGVFVPLEDLAQATVSPSVKGPRRWITTELGGQVIPSHGLRYSYDLAQWWLKQRPFGTPPILIHCLDGQNCDASYAFLSRSLQLLATPRGNLTLFHCVFTEDVSKDFLSNLGDCRLPSQLSWWPQNCGCDLADVFHREPISTRVSYSINSMPTRRIKRLIQSLDRYVFSPREKSLDNQPPLQTKKHWLVKRGNSETEWEDSYAENVEQGIIAIADGASEGIFAQTWAKILTRRFVEQLPELEDPVKFERWLQGCRAEWMQYINYGNLRYTQQLKVDSIGSGATFLGLQIEKSPSEQNVGKILGVWRAWAIGDSCLFWVRDNKLLASFPAVHSNQFVSPPALLRTKPEALPPTPLMARGNWQPGDLFVLATDAISQHLLTSLEEGSMPNWCRYWHMDQSEWKVEIERLRESGKIVNDDSTMILLQIGNSVG